MLEKAMRLCEAAFGILCTYDGEHFRVRGDARRARSSLPSICAASRSPAGPDSALRPIVAGERCCPHRRCRERRRVPPQRPATSRWSNSAASRTLLAVPLRKDDALLGAFRVYRQEVRPFTDKQIALLQNFAAQAVIAMENARLHHRDARGVGAADRDRRGVAGHQFLARRSRAGVRRDAGEGACACAGPHSAVLRLYDGEQFPRGRDARRAGAFAELLRQPFAPSAGITAAAAACAASASSTSPMWRKPTHCRDDPSAAASIELGGVRTLLGVPLRKDDALLGYHRRLPPGSAAVHRQADRAACRTSRRRRSSRWRTRGCWANCASAPRRSAELNRDLEARVAEQVDELGRVGRLKRFLAPQLAELIVSQGDEKILESHRREIVVVFCDLRGYTAFTETAEPEEVLDFLREYHGALGPLVSQFEGTLDQFSGDGIMVFFNDPVPCPDPAERAVKMAVAMREAAGTLIADWRERGRDLGFGAGIAQGYATLGQIGFSERSGYTAIGTVCNVAARLCAEAKDGQILLGQRVNVALKGSVATEQLGALTLKGLTQPVVAYNVPLAAIQPALRVIEGGSPQTV